VKIFSCGSLTELQIWIWLPSFISLRTTGLDVLGCTDLWQAEMTKAVCEDLNFFIKQTFSENSVTQ